MSKRHDESDVQAFISWKTGYDCNITIINEQHQEILSFINNWYQDIKENRISSDNIVKYLREKFKYLDFYSKYHLAFEESMLEIIVDKHRFPVGDYEKHVMAHKNFMMNFMAVLSDEIDLVGKDSHQFTIDNIATEALKDVARWWFNHIRTPTDNTPASPDHIYRTFLAKMPPEERCHLLNDVIRYFAEPAKKAALNSF